MWLWKSPAELKFYFNTARRLPAAVTVCRWSVNERSLSSRARVPYGNSAVLEARTDIHWGGSSPMDQGEGSYLCREIYSHYWLLGDAFPQEGSIPECMTLGT